MLRSTTDMNRTSWANIYEVLFKQKTTVTEKYENQTLLRISLGHVGLGTLKIDTF